MIPIKYNLRSLAVRKTTSVATALGIALVVFVLASALMLSAGIKRTLATGGHANVAIVMRQGSDNELSSGIEAANVSLVAAGPGVKRDVPASGEAIVVLAMEKVGVDGVANVQARGVTSAALGLRPEVKVVEGVAPRAGAEEVMVGKRIAGRFKGLALGQTFELRKNRPVKVVGVFEADGSSSESEVWCDLDILRNAFARQGYVSSVRVQLDSPAAFDGFKAAMESDKQYGFLALRETDYLEKQSEGTAMFIGVLGTLISVFFAAGAMIGAMITMYAAVANRQREIGTLRALGFSRTSILGCFLLESTVLALIGGAVGASAALLMRFVKFSMMNFSSWSEIVFTFQPTAPILVVSLVFAGSMGLLGGFFPAVAAARVSAIQAMRG
ncbi:MAG: ABC transporter permease [Myxococcales bacterium]|nr:ABC transporter permease [Myxococcales bacterium]MBL8715340.1 ABC transporter permease [Myxococcales bacterium]